MPRGGFDLERGESLTGVAGPAHPVRSVLLVGHAGPGMWRCFSRGRRDGPEPLDRWSRSVLEACARAFGCTVVMPSDGPPWAPFQVWALRAGRVHRSPVGLLIDPVWGLWHAYRGALLLPWRLEVPQPPPRPSPCERCRDRPCLTACPVGAFSAGGFDPHACRSHLAAPEGRGCVDGGCRARDACPVGIRYPAPQVRFHMRAWVGGAGPDASEAGSAPV